MSAMRQDPSHRSGPAGWSRVRAAGESPERERGGVLSVVVPAKNEAASLPQLVAEIAGALRPLCGVGRAGHRLDGFEIMIVDDGSTDETPLVLRRLAKDYPELRPLSLVSNVGQSAATSAGFRAARGDWVATLDADLQNNPADRLGRERRPVGGDGGRLEGRAR
jgi:dolichol-phosphate mannosyltransferase